MLALYCRLSAVRIAGPLLVKIMSSRAVLVRTDYTRPHTINPWKRYVCSLYYTD